MLQCNFYAYISGCCNLQWYVRTCIQCLFNAICIASHRSLATLTWPTELKCCEEREKRRSTSACLQEELLVDTVPDCLCLRLSVCLCLLVCMYSMYVCLSVCVCLSVPLCLSVCLSLSLSSYLSVCLSVPVCLSLPVFLLSVCLSVCLSLRLSFCRSICMFVCVYLSPCLSVCLSVCHIVGLSIL